MGSHKGKLRLVSVSDLYDLADDLRAVANAGLLYAQNDYDRDRYVRVLKASAGMVALADNRDESEVLKDFQDNLLHLSPLAGSSAVIFENQKVLLGRRVDNGLWGTFGGLVEVGETLAEAAVREAFEEVGLEVRVTKLLGIFDSRLWRTRTKAQLYHVHFQAEIAGGTPTTSNEVSEFAWFAEDELPDLHYSEQLVLPVVFKLLRSELPAPYFDLPGQLLERADDE